MNYSYSYICAHVLTLPVALSRIFLSRGTLQNIMTTANIIPIRTRRPRMEPITTPISSPSAKTTTTNND